MRVTTLLILSALIAGCGPAEGVGGETAPESASPAPENHSESARPGSSEDDVVDLAVRDLASRLGREPGEIVVVAVEGVEWPDRGLGCPLPGAVYAQVITRGYRIRLEAVGEVYTYHADTGQTFVLCRDGSPELPVIAVDPDKIKDGTPWMPVGPPPDVPEDSAIAEPDTDR